MPSRTELFNQALAHATVGGSISDADENSREANVCRLFYPTVRRKILGMASWPSATKSFKLAELSARVDGVDWAQGAPSPQYRYAYSVPSDLVRPRYLDTFSRFDYSLYDDDTKAIHTDAVQPVLTYTKDQENVVLWDTALYEAIGLALGAYISPKLNGKEGTVNRLLQYANAAIETARAGAVNTDHENYDWAAPWIEARFDVLSGGPRQTRYIYPVDTLFVTSNATPTVTQKTNPLRSR